MLLLDVQERVLETLKNSSRGHIDVHVRQEMWSALGPVVPRSAREIGEVSTAHRARAFLMAECLRVAIPEWNADKELAGSEVLLDPRDEPTAVLGYVDDYFEGKIQRSELVKHVNRLDDLSFYLFELHERFPRSELIGHASCNVLWVAAWDQVSDYEPDYREEDNEVFPADFMIAWLKSGCAPWEPDLEAVTRRREYWSWYIEDAFARAWAIAYP